MTLKLYKALVGVFGVSLIVLCSSYFASWIYAVNTPPLAQNITQPFLTNTSGIVIHKAKAGDSIVYNVRVLRQPFAQCWAEYVNILSGPVNYQFPPLKSQVLSKLPVESDIRSFLKIPTDLPAGTYKWRQIANPTCRGIDVPPIEFNMNGLELIIE